MEILIQTYFTLTVFGLLTIFNGAGGLRDVVLRVPVAVSTGSTATLHCLYDLEGDQLYTVKWYKGRQEFFRYVLKELPHTRVFALPGINVDVVASGTDRVVLRDVQKSLSGNYHCEVTSDQPHFHTYVVSASMHVVDDLEDQPEIRLEKSSYSVGDTLRGNCSYAPTSPRPNITWYINGEKEEASSVWYHGNVTAAVTVAEISVELSSESFPAGKLNLRCVADLFSITKTTRELWLDEDRPRLASVLGTRDSAACSEPGSTVLLEIALIAVHHYCCR